MSISDPIANMITKVRNAGLAKHESVDIISSKIKLELIKILKSEGYIKNFKIFEDEGRHNIRIFLKYDEKKKPVIRGIVRISKPGRRIYSGYRTMPRVYNGFGTVMVSTSAGVTTGKKARELQSGGELVCSVW